MECVVVAGIPGAGKTTIANRLAARLDLPRHELDTLHHGPNWQPRPSFRGDVEHIAASARWVTEDQYPAKLDDLLIARADTYVWLDLPRRTVMPRVFGRSLVRASAAASCGTATSSASATGSHPSTPSTGPGRSTGRNAAGRSSASPATRTWPVFG